jgi:hypothetical protein
MASAEQVLELTGKVRTDKQAGFDWSVPPGAKRASIVSKIAALRQRSLDSHSLDGLDEARAIGRGTGARV